MVTQSQPSSIINGESPTEEKTSKKKKKSENEYFVIQREDTAPSGNIKMHPDLKTVSQGRQERSAQMTPFSPALRRGCGRLDKNKHFKSSFNVLESEVAQSCPTLRPHEL